MRADLQTNATGDLAISGQVRTDLPVLPSDLSRRAKAGVVASSASMRACEPVAFALRSTPTRTPPRVTTGIAAVPIGGGSMAGRTTKGRSLMNMMEVFVSRW